MTQFDDFQVGIDANGDGDFDDAGDDLLVSDDFTSNQVGLSYDDNGNLTADGVYNYVYDAWNRLRKAQLKVGADVTAIGDYQYYGDTRRALKIVSNRGAENTPNDGGDTEVRFYYDHQWRMIETRNGSSQTTMQMLPGTQYTDEWVWIEVNGNPTIGNDTDPDTSATGEGSESPADARHFVHQDRQPLTRRPPLRGADRFAIAEPRSVRRVKGYWNVIALTEYDPNGTNNGRIAERYAYTPYGEFTVLAGDGGNGELCSPSPASTVGNVFAHQGLPIDQEKGNHYNRYREYVTPVARFAQPDPLGYSGGLNTFLALDADPLLWLDSLGGCAGQCGSATCDYVRECCPGGGEALGAVSCENGQPCTCVFDGHIDQKYPQAGPVISVCVAEEEYGHCQSSVCGDDPCSAADTNPEGECERTADHARCIADQVSYCTQPGGNPAACLGELHAHVLNLLINCGTNCGTVPGMADCIQAACDAFDALNSAAQSAGLPPIPPPPPCDNG